MSVIILVCAVLLASFDCSKAAVDDDLITSLPGLQEMPKFKQYSGYLKATGSKHLHYWFVESANDPSTDPLVLWMNGGPGCSSLAGLLMEHGPFRPNEKDLTLTENPYSWNKVANIIYLEAPAGVGFSYSEDQQYATGDDEVSKANLEALKSFFKGFPEFAKNDFYITGESYGGIYVPTLSVRVDKESSINFKGFAVGNGMSDFFMNTDSIIFFGNYHGLWGKHLWSQLVDSCCVSSNISNCDFSKNTSDSCSFAVVKAGEIIQNLNIYNLYQDCYYPRELSSVRSVPPRDSRPLGLGGFTAQEELKMTGYSEKHNSILMKQFQRNLKVSPPCVNADPIKDYLNQDSVKKALHIKEGLPAWDICSDVVSASYTIEYSTMIKQYLYLMSTGKYRALIYNGDVDMACNFLMDEWFVDSLGQKVVKSTHSWMYKAADGSQQVGGFAKVFKDIQFVTIKGAGHMVPTDKPIPALHMVSHFLSNNAL